MGVLVVVGMACVLCLAWYGFPLKAKASAHVGRYEAVGQTPWRGTRRFRDLAITLTAPPPVARDGQW